MSEAPKSEAPRSGAGKGDLPAHCVSQIRTRVRFYETDMMGVVHHSNYLRYFELARVEYLRRRGMDYSESVARGVHLPVIHAETSYRRSAHLDDVLVIETRLETLSRIKVGFSYRVLRVQAGDGNLGGVAEGRRRDDGNGSDGDEGELIATGKTLLACVNAKHQPTRLDKDTEALLRSPERGDAERDDPGRGNAAEPGNATQV